MTIDETRTRWRAYRSTWRITERDAQGDRFADGGLSPLVEAPSVRILVLPADPDWPKLSFSQAIWGLLPPQPSTPWGGQLGFFSSEVATSDAALRVELGRESATRWTSYLGIHHNGAVEMEMGCAGGWTRQDRDGNPVRLFMLGSIVRWTWTGLDLHRQIAALADFRKGPVEVTVALRDLVGASLTDLGEGWQEPHNAWAGRAPTAVEGHALLRIEVDDISDTDELKAAALEIGSRVDNCFGSHQDRHIDHRGDRAGEFVPGRR